MFGCTPLKPVRLDNGLLIDVSAPLRLCGCLLFSRRSCVGRGKSLYYCIVHPVTIENDAICMDVWPQIGGKVSSIIDKADHFELLFTYPSELPDSPNYDVPYADHWFCGWDECFPAVAPCVYPRHPYQGIGVPDHGELWGIPTTTAVPTKDGITTVWHGLRFGYRLTRKLFLEETSVVAEYSLTNLAPFEFRFVWAMHALMSMTSPVEFDAGGAKAFRLSHGADGQPIDQAFDWPAAPGGEILWQPRALPPKRGWKSFCADPIQSPWVIRYPKRNRSVEIEYSSEDMLPAYWGIWINTGGWGGGEHFAIEPTAGRFDQLDRAIRDGSAGRLAGFGRCQWAVRWKLG